MGKLYKKGGEINPDNKGVKNYFAHGSGKAGGVLVGKRHSEGGIKAVNKSTGQPLEMEGGEVVITRNAVSDNTKREFNGQMLTNREILSKINESGGGVSFAKGGDVPKTIYTSGKEYKYGGKTMKDHDIVSSCGCKHEMKKGGSLSKTKAPLKDRVFGSNKNKPGSAASKESAKKITLSDEIVKALQKKVDEYKKQHPSSKLSLITLKAVMRRGMGAYSTSHRPTITGGAPNSRQAWGYARVNKFLKKKAGQKVKAAYVQDDDLLKSGGRIQWHDSDAPDANGKFKSLNTKELASWLIKTRGKDMQKISASITQQIVFNRKKDPKYASKMERVRKEVYKQLGRKDLMANGGDLNQEITCVNCGWHWNTKDSDESDKYICHKCGFDNRTYYDSDPVGKIQKQIALPDTYSTYDNLKPLLEKQGYEINKISQSDLQDKSIFNKALIYKSIKPLRQANEIIEKIKSMERQNKMEDGGETMKNFKYSKVFSGVTIYTNTEQEYVGNYYSPFESKGSFKANVVRGDLTNIAIESKDLQDLNLKWGVDDWNTIAKKLKDKNIKELELILVGKIIKSYELKPISKMASGANMRDGGILFTINDDKIDDLLYRSNFNSYVFLDDDGYLLSEKDFEKFKVIVSDKGYDENKIDVQDWNYTDYKIGGNLRTSPDFLKGKKEELEEHRDTFEKLRKNKLTADQAAELVVLEHLKKKPDYYKKYSTGGKIQIEDKKIISYKEFLDLDQRVKSPYDNENNYYYPLYCSKNRMIMFFKDGNRRKNCITPQLAYKSFLFHRYKLDFKDLSAKEKNALMLGKQSLLENN
jgi:hypothetical protein